MYCIMEKSPANQSMTPTESFVTSTTEVLDDRFINDWTGSGKGAKEYTATDLYSLTEFNTMSSEDWEEFVTQYRSSLCAIADSSDSGICQMFQTNSLTCGSTGHLQKETGR